MLAQRNDETILEYWISFWPVAPFFGVRWRFEGVAPGFPSGFDADPGRTPPPDRAMAQAVAPMTPPVADVDTVERTAEIVEEVSEEIVEERAEDAAEVVEETAAAMEDAPVAGPPGGLYAERPDAVDDLKQIRGVGPKLETLLNDLGIYRFEQIAGFSEDDLAWIDDRLATFKGRPLRDGWIAQAKSLR